MPVALPFKSAINLEKRDNFTTYFANVILKYDY